MANVQTTKTIDVGDNKKCIRIGEKMVGAGFILGAITLFKLARPRLNCGAMGCTR
jgi:hypothetical protein